MVSGFWLSRAVQVAATLKIPDLVADGPKSVDELAAATSCNPGALYRVLRGLASFGVFRELNNRRFASTATTEVLRSDIPGSMRATVMTELGNFHYKAWGDLITSVKTGEVAFDRVFGHGPWEYLEQNPDMSELFNESMTRVTEVVERGVSEVYDFSPYRKIVDVGGGQGRLLSAMLRSNTNARGVLFDSPRVIEQARRVLTGNPEADRIDFVGGDFFENVPEGGDLYTLKWIIHDWAEREALRILRNIRCAMAPGARVLLLECVLPEANHADFGSLMDVNMLVMTGGRERRASEYAELLAEAGLRMTQVYLTQSPVSIVEAVA